MKHTYAPSKLETLVEKDMLSTGYNPLNRRSVELYWDQRLRKQEVDFGLLYQDLQRHSLMNVYSDSPNKGS
jgi:hypothetical protein